MGSSSSRIRSSSGSGSGSRPKRSKLKLSSFFCGGASTSQLDHEVLFLIFIHLSIVLCISERKKKGNLFCCFWALGCPIWVVVWFICVVFLIILILVTRCWSWSKGVASICFFSFSPLLSWVFLLLP